MRKKKQNIKYDIVYYIVGKKKPSLLIYFISSWVKVIFFKVYFIYRVIVSFLKGMTEECVCVAACWGRLRKPIAELIKEEMTLSYISS